MELRISGNGKLDLHSVDELSPNELNEWIWARLHEEDTIAPDDPKQNVGQYYLVGAIYDGLMPETQAETRRILKRFLRQLEGGGEDWQGRAAHDLLLLVMKVQESELAPAIRRMAEREQFAEGDDADEELHARLLQALVFLGEKVTSKFWKRQIEREPVRYGALAFSGLLMHSLYEALGVLKKLDLSAPEVQSQLYSAIRGLLASKQYNRDDLRAVLRDMCSTLPREAYEFIVSVLPELEMTTETANQEASRFSEHLSAIGSQREPESLDLAAAA